MTLATGIGSMPGADAEAYSEAVRVVLGELPDLPFAPELPGRGAIAGMTGRTLAVVADLGADLQPAGWRLTDAAGVDQRRARSLLAQDLDSIEELSQDRSGAFKLQIAGPWTLAATVERPRGDKVLSDHGARRELAQALAEGVRTHVADCRRRLSGVDRLVVQVDEPALAAVVTAQVPTASGLNRHRAVDLPEASAHLEWVLDAITDSGAEPWVHSCAPQTPWSLIVGAGAQGLAADLSLLGATDLDTFAEALEQGRTAALGVVSSLDPASSEARSGAGDGSTTASDAPLVERVLRWSDMLGLDLESLGDSLAITPTCGLAGASPAWGRRALALSQSVARQLSG